MLFVPLGWFAGLAGVRSRRQTGRGLGRFLAPLAMSIPCAMAMTSCGGDKIIPVPSAAPGIYSIAVIATGANSAITHTATLTLTVTP
jgi:hypothetical protein